MLIRKSFFGLCIAFYVYLSMISVSAMENPSRSSGLTSVLTRGLNSDRDESEGIFDVTSYGVSPNTDSDFVPAFLQAASAASAYVKKTQRPAEIFVPSGKYFMSQFQIKDLSQIHVHLGENAEIYAYPKSKSIDSRQPYMTIENCDHFILSGEKGSLLDGAGDSWWIKKDRHPDFISIENCRDYEVYGLSILNSPNHTIQLSNCKNGKLHDLSIIAPADSPSTDGIDPMSNIDNLEIYNCFISNGDDGIAINSNMGEMNAIYIHDCILKNGHGLSFGSAIHYDITNVRVENLTVEDAWHAIRFKFSDSNRKARLKNIKFQHINAKNLTRDAIKITTEYEGGVNKTVTLKDISIHNFTCQGALRGLSLSLADKKQALTPLILNQVNITGTQNKDIIKNVPIQRS